MTFDPAHSLPASGTSRLISTSSCVGLKGFVNYVTVVLFQLPFYFMELLVGVLQGMVFAMLNVVFIKLSTTHDEGHGEHDEAHAH